MKSLSVVFGFYISLKSIVPNNSVVGAVEISTAGGAPSAAEGPVGGFRLILAGGGISDVADSVEAFSASATAAAAAAASAAALAFFPLGFLKAQKHKALH